MFNLSETAKISCHYDHSQQLEPSLGKRTELIYISNKIKWIKLLEYTKHSNSGTSVHNYILALVTDTE